MSQLTLLERLPPLPHPFGAIRSSSLSMRKRCLRAGDPAGGRDDVRSFMGFMTKVSFQEWYANAIEDDNVAATARQDSGAPVRPACPPASSSLW
jgi:hypothetical protein